MDIPLEDLIDIESSHQEIKMKVVLPFMVKLMKATSGTVKVSCPLLLTFQGSSGQ